MFEAVDFKKSLQIGKVKWIGASLFWRHLMLFLLLLSLNYVSVVGVVKEDFLGFKIALSLFFILLPYTIYIIHKNAKLIEVVINSPPLHLRTILENEIVNSGRRVVRSNQQYLTSLKPGGPIFGSRITIIYHNRSIFINVQNNQWNSYFPFSFGKNKRVANEFIQIIKDADQNLSS